MSNFAFQSVYWTTFRRKSIGELHLYSKCCQDFEVHRFLPFYLLDFASSVLYYFVPVFALVLAFLSALALVLVSAFALVLAPVYALTFVSALVLSFALLHL